ncbi:MAG: hypothetical protein FVQ77_05245 [Cytophagales bacterium]|nr:hypothetical protein [Cytophagales bacterium]
MAKSDFIAELTALGFTVQEPDALKVSFEYEVTIGRNIGKKLQIGFEVQNDYPMSCPPGPHFKSIGIQDWVEPPNNIHASAFGGEWKYWSRPFPDWNRTDRKVKTYFAHIKNLLAKL